MVVAYGGPRLVADPPAGVVHPPHQVDVLGHREVVLEPGAQRLPPGEQRRAGQVGHPAQRLHRRGPGPEVERGPGGLVATQPAVVGTRLRPEHARTHDADRRVVEVPAQQREPAAHRHHVGVEERDVVGQDGGETGVAGGRRAAAGVVPQQPRAELGRDRAGGAGVRGAVVDHDDGQRRRERVEQPGELAGPVLHGHHDRHVVDGGVVARRRRPHRVGQAAVEQQPGHGAGVGVAGHQRPVGEHRPGPREQVQHRAGAAEQRPAAVGRPGVPPQPDREPHGQGRRPHRNPPSALTTDPCTTGPAVAANSTTAATSSGSSGLPVACAWASSSTFTP